MNYLKQYISRALHYLKHGYNRCRLIGIFYIKNTNEVETPLHVTYYGSHYLPKRL